MFKMWYNVIYGYKIYLKYIQKEVAMKRSKIDKMLFKIAANRGIIITDVKLEIQKASDKGIGVYNKC